MTVKSNRQIVSVTFEIRKIGNLLVVKLLTGVTNGDCLGVVTWGQGRFKGR
jgi:hypothetical protein